MDPLADIGIRADVNKGADIRTGTHPGALADHVIQPDAVGNFAVLHPGVRPDRAALPDHGAPAEDCVGQNEGIAPDPHVRPDDHAVRARDIHTLREQGVKDTPAGDPVELHQLGPVICAEHHTGIGGGIDARALASPPQDRHGVRQIVLALRIVPAQPLQAPEQVCAVKPEGAGVDLINSLFLFVGIFLLYNAGEGAVPVVDYDASVAIRIIHTGGDDGGGVSLARMLFKRVPDCLRVDQRGISVEYNHTAALLRNKIRCRTHRITGAELALLTHGYNILRQMGAQLLRPAAGHHADLRDPGPAYGVNHPVNHRLEQNPAHRLGSG